MRNLCACGYLYTNDFICTKCGRCKPVEKIGLPKLEDWSITHFDNDLYVAPELYSLRLQGVISNDSRGFADGTAIVTSKIIKLDIENKSAETLNTKYILGKIDIKYNEWLKNNNIEIKSFVIESED